jgi:amidase
MRQARRIVVSAAVLLLMLTAGCFSALQANPSPAPVPQPAIQGGDCLASLKGIDLQNATIADLQVALASGRVTSVDLVDAYAARIAAYDAAGPKLNSVQVVNPHARAEATALDAERAAGHVRGPLHGIPILLKDNVGTNEMPTTAGSIALEKNVPPRNATLTDRLVAQGAVILGKAHLSEFAQWISLNNPNGYSSLGGQVVNAYTGGDPSGSSAGSGVAGSMAFAAATIGTETQGSILGPSDANSLVGVKPTVGLVSRAGVIPLAASFDTPGPMARSVADAAAVLSAIAGPDPRDAATAGAASHIPVGGNYTKALDANALQGHRLGYDASHQSDSIFSRALDDLRAAGATLVPIQDPPNRDNAGTSELGLIPNEFKFGINDYLAHEAGPGLPVSDLTGIIQLNQQHPDKVKYGQDLLIASDATPGNGALASAAGMAANGGAGTANDALFTQNGVDAIVGPSLSYYQMGAEAGYPTVIVPAGYNGKNPEGLSIFGPAWSEARLLGFAYAYEQHSLRRLAPTVVNADLLKGVCGAG